MKNFRKNNGITLVALIITIIVLLIIAAVTIMALDGENGIIRKSKQARVDYEKGKQEEEGLLSGYLSKMDEISSEESSGDNGGSIEGGEENSGDDNSGSNSSGENSEDNSSTGNNSSNNTIGTIISKSEAFVGYYADVDADGTVDGVIYADLAIGNTGDGKWKNSDGNYTINRVDNVKDYYISQTKYSGDFGTKDVLSATGNGNDRFYVMALTDFNRETQYCWYDAAHGNMNDYSYTTSVDFGRGKQNTLNMIEKWNNKAYGAQNDGGTYKDVWGEIQTKVNEGWFVPSRAEWSAFGEELGITEDNYENKDLGHYYWCSSQYSIHDAWYTYFGCECMSNRIVFAAYSVRLSTTF